ncbi:MAG: D-glycerate dehydrogenase [Candidatus Pacebacteria bacterium]|nr:D-glycerate dehydrogenase [Candidatus Paceibacterota bacterium]
MSKSVYITRVIPSIAVEMLKKRGYDVDVYPHDRVPSQREIIKALQKKQYDAVISLLTDKVDATLFDATPSVKLYANYATGFDNIDVAEAKKRGIQAANTPGNYAYTIAEHTLALMLGLTTRMVEADRFTRAGKYKGWSPMNLVGTDLKGKKLGLIGAGRIGERVAHHCYHGFDMEIVYHDINRNETLDHDYHARRCETVEEVLVQSDIVSLHVPLLDSTHHLMNELRLKMMKPTAFLINTSRGPVVDENALVKALQDGAIAGAGLDVFEFEPKLARGLNKLPNVILTPHIASARESARTEMAKVAAQNVIEFIEHGTVKNSVIK